jgi:hypothetical protein
MSGVVVVPVMLATFVPLLMVILLCVWREPWIGSPAAESAGRE